MATIPDVRITCDPEIMGGWPCVEGTRIPARTILACINAGNDRALIAESYPSLPAGGYDAVVRWAAEQGLDCSAS